MRSRLIAVSSLLVVSGVLSACSSSGHDATPGPEATTPSASPTSGAADQLAGLAALGRKLSFSATYRVTGKSPGLARIVRTPLAYRFELTTGSKPKRHQAVLIRTTRGSISCTIEPAPTTCFTVAAPGQPIPATFDAGLQHVFTDYLTTLSTPGNGYDAQTAPTQAGDFACFDVSTSTSTTPAPSGAVAAGTYCFTATGMVSRVVYPSGQAALLKTGPAPRTADFKPPVKPRPLP